MIEWLNTNLGSDTANYFGLLVGIVALFISGNKYKKWKKNSIRQNSHNINGNVNQAARDINYYYSANNSDSNQLKKKYEHDLKIIKEILETLPYEDTLEWVERSYIAGLPRDVCLNMEKAEKFSGENYRLFNIEVHNAKDALIEAIRLFLNSAEVFLTIDYPDKVPMMLSLPHDWKYKGEQSEKAFRTHQQNLRETSGEMVERYKEFVKTIKIQEFIIDKF